MSSKFNYLRYISSSFLLRKTSGFSLVGALTASVIGLMVTYGITHNLVQTKLYQLSIEKKDRRKSLYRFVDNVLSDSQSCLNTLQGQALSGDSTHTDRSFEITALKDANNGKLMDFSKTNGILDDAATKEKLKNLGIDKFESLKFRYKTALPRTGQVVLTSKTEVKGLHEKSNRELIWEISGLKVETKTNNGVSSEQVTLCQDSVPLKILCGDNVTGTGHLNGGGFVQSTATVDSGAYVSDTAVVCGNAKVKGNARVFGNAQVTGNAEIKGNALVYDNAKVYGDAVIQDNAKIYDSAKVYGDAVIQDNAKIYDSAKVYGDAKAKDNAEIYGMSEVKGSAEVKGGAKVFGNSIVYESAIIKGNAKIYATANIYGSAEVYGNAKVWGMARVLGSTTKIYGNANIWANAWIPGGRVYGNAKVSRDGGVYDNARVYGNAHIKEAGGVGGSAHFFGDSYLGGRGRVYGNARVNNIIIGDHSVSGSCVCTRTTKKNLRQSCSASPCITN